ncbi:MAG: type II secretion system protein [Firmicutes bacterium]|nr:type II secretion system protein [Bacillota bacterium]
MKVRRHFQQNKKGITLGELLITVAILVIIMAVALPAVTSLYKNINQKELDDKAQIIYVSVQNKLSKMKASGNTKVYKYEGETAENKVMKLAGKPTDVNAPDNSYSEGDICYFTSEDLKTAGTAASAIMNGTTMDESLLNQHWVIEYNPKEATVYSVFYSEGLYNCAEKYVASYTSYNSDLRYKEKRLEAGAKVGYYGGGLLNLKTDVATLTPVLKITNAEKLVAEVSCEIPESVTDLPAFKVDLEDVDGKKYTKYYGYWAGTSEYKNKVRDIANEAGVDYECDAPVIKQSDCTYTLNLVLDDLSSDSTRFTNAYGENSSNTVKLKSGTPLKVTATALCPQNYAVSQNISDTKITNSLFADENNTASGSDDTMNKNYGNVVSPAVVKYGRHLQNLDSLSGVENASITHVVQGSDISFKEKAESEELRDWQKCYGKEYFNGLTDNVPNFKPIINSKITSFDGKPDKTSYTIENLTAVAKDAKNPVTDAGLFGIVSGQALEIKNVTMTGTKVQAAMSGDSYTGSAGAIVGNAASKITLDSCKVFLTEADVDGKTNKDVWIAGNKAGGLIGSVSGASVTINGSSASTVITSNNTSASKQNISSAGGLIGMFATNKDKEKIMKIDNSYADCYITGDYAGGLVGEFDSNFSATIANCYVAGYLTYKSLGAGIICGKMNIQNAYTAISLIDCDIDKNYYSTAEPGNKTAEKVFYKTPSKNHNFKDTTQITSDLTAEKMVVALGGEFTDITTGSTPYNLMNQGLSEGGYPYPVLTGLHHYGDWSN